MSRFLQQTWLVASKDLRSEFRTKEVLNAACAFSVTVLLLYSFAFESSEADMYEIGGGLLWMVFLFAAILVLNRSFARESANGCLEAIVASPISGAALFTGKAFANWVLLVMVEALALPVFGLFYNVSWVGKLPVLAPCFLLGSWGLVAVGTIFSAITANNRLRELMLPLLVFPLALPILLACVQITRVTLLGEGPDIDTWFRLILGFDLIFSLLGASLIDFVLTS